MNRTKWEFQYKASDVALMAKVKSDLHQRRLDYWTKEMDTAKEAMKASVEIREYETGYVNHSNKLSRENLQVVADPERQRRYAHCIDKMQEHMARIEEYNSYWYALKDQDIMIPLTVNDIIFFGMIDDASVKDDGE